MKDYDIERILKPSLKLFLTNNYEGVSTAKLEEETGLTRGAIFFKYKNKESLFKAVVDKYVLEFKPGVTEFKGVNSLKDFIDMFLLDIERRMNEMHSLGIPDVHRGYFNLLYQALKYYPGSDVMISEMLDKGVQIWESIIQKAKESGEIKPTCNAHEIALQFKYLYSGMAVENSFCNGLQVSSLRSLYYSLYKELRNEK